MSQVSSDKDVYPTGPLAAVKGVSWLALACFLRLEFISLSMIQIEVETPMSFLYIIYIFFFVYNFFAVMTDVSPGAAS